jgi:hypothetical protein
LNQPGDSEARREHDHEIQSLQIEISNLLKQKDQQIKLIEITGGQTSPLFDDYLDTLTTLDTEIKKVKGEIEQKKAQKPKLSPIMSSLLASLSSSDVDSSKKRKISSSAGEPRSAITCAQVEVDVMRRSPAAMSTLTEDSSGIEDQQMQLSGTDRD